jgi:hypothetical protein
MFVISYWYRAWNSIKVEVERMQYIKRFYDKKNIVGVIKTTIFDVCGKA